MPCWATGSRWELGKDQYHHCKPSLALGASAKVLDFCELIVR